jgi:hypothetical protein
MYDVEINKRGVIRNLYILQNCSTRSEGERKKWDDHATMAGRKLASYSNYNDLCYVIETITQKLI